MNRSQCVQYSDVVKDDWRRRMSGSRISVNVTADCVGSANCVLSVPDVFRYDEELGRSIVVRPLVVSPDQSRLVGFAAEQCPVGAILISSVRDEHLHLNLDIGDGEVCRDDTRT
jgi:ferredoxin